MSARFPAVLSVLILSVTPCLIAGEAADTPAPAGDAASQLVAISNSREVFHTAFKTMFDPFLQQLRDSGQVSEEKIGQLEKAALGFANRVYDDPGFTDGIASVYRKHFTEQEMKDLLAFYKTPLGGKLLATLPTVFQESADVGRQLAARHQAGFQAEVQAILMDGEEKAAADAAKTEAADEAAEEDDAEKGK